MESDDTSKYEVSTTYIYSYKACMLQLFYIANTFGYHCVCMVTLCVCVCVCVLVPTAGQHQFWYLYWHLSQYQHSTLMVSESVKHASTNFASVVHH